MDAELVHQCVNYHGPSLVDLLSTEQPDVPLPNFLSLGRPLNKEEPRDEIFTEKLNSFIAKKADLLFLKRGTDVQIRKPARDESISYAVMAPLESYMEVPSSLMRDHFFKSIGGGDLVIGFVTAIQESGLTVTLLCLDAGKIRDLRPLKILTFCPLREIPKYYAHESPLDAFSIKDKVRGIILSVNEETEKIIISLQTRALPSDKDHIKMGLISDEELPVHFRRLERLEGQTYSQDLQKLAGFYNPSSVDYLCTDLRLDEENPPSLMRGLHRIKIPRTEYFDVLRKNQSNRWALKSVAEGIEHFKNNRHPEAMQYFNKALEMDPGNVEALVARGAVYANNESYNRAIEDFEEALKENPRHVNAKKYLCETLLAQAHSFHETGRSERALTYLDQALILDPDLKSAHVMMDMIRQEMEGQREVSLGDSKEAISISESDCEIIKEEHEQLAKTTETLKKLIQQERKSKLKRKRKRRQSSSSSSSSSTSSSSSEAQHAKSSSKVRRRSEGVIKVRNRSSSSSSSESSSSPSAQRSRNPSQRYRRQRSTSPDSYQSSEVVPLYRTADLSPESQKYLHSMDSAQAKDEARHQDMVRGRGSYRTEHVDIQDKNVRNKSGYHSGKVQYEKDNNKDVTQTKLRRTSRSPSFEKNRAAVYDDLKRRSRSPLRDEKTLYKDEKWKPESYERRRSKSGNQPHEFSRFMSNEGSHSPELRQARTISTERTSADHKDKKYEEYELKSPNDRQREGQECEKEKIQVNIYRRRPIRDNEVECKKDNKRYDRSFEILGDRNVNRKKRYSNDSVERKDQCQDSRGKIECERESERLELKSKKRKIIEISDDEFKDDRNKYSEKRKSHERRQSVDCVSKKKQDSKERDRRKSMPYGKHPNKHGEDNVKDRRKSDGYYRKSSDKYEKRDDDYDYSKRDVKERKLDKISKNAERKYREESKDKINQNVDILRRSSLDSLKGYGKSSDSGDSPAYIKTRRSTGSNIKNIPAKEMKKEKTDSKEGGRKDSERVQKTEKQDKEQEKAKAKESLAEMENFLLQLKKNKKEQTEKEKAAATKAGSKK